MFVIELNAKKITCKIYHYNCLVAYMHIFKEIIQILLHNVEKESFQSIPQHQNAYDLHYPAQRSEGNFVLHNQIIVTLYIFENKNITLS